jgi:hypothetical protein
MYLREEVLYLMQLGGIASHDLIEWEGLHSPHNLIIVLLDVLEEGTEGVIDLLTLYSVEVDTLHHLPLTLTELLQDLLFVLLELLLELTIPIHNPHELLVVELLHSLLLLVQLVYVLIHLLPDALQLFQERIGLFLLLVLLTLDLLNLVLLKGELDCTLRTYPHVLV